MMNSNLTLTAKNIVQSNIGFRNPYLFDGEDHSAKDAYEYETIELQNDDIQDFIKNQYNVTITSSETFDDWLHNLKQFSQKAELFLYWFTSQQAVYDLYSALKKQFNTPCLTIILLYQILAQTALQLSQTNLFLLSNKLKLSK